MDATHLDRRMLGVAARAALRAAGDTDPNPLVGAVIARGDQILSIGHHRRFGGPHAEREAIDACLAAGHSPRGATMYVTLEPCSHWGKQPPCVDAVLAAGLARVVYARPDPNPQAAGGAAMLAKAGVRVELCRESPLATGVGAPFAKRVTTGLPWVIAKWAQTIDGRVATRSGESKWISSAASRARVHRLRTRVDAILTGIGTVLADDPSLTPRRVRRVRRTPRRVIADTDLDIPTSFAVVRTAHAYPTSVVCARELAHAEITAAKRAVLREHGVEVLGVRASAAGVDLRELLRELATRHAVCTVLVEAGPGLLGSLLDLDLIDEAVVYIAPLMLGDELAKGVAAGRVAPTLDAAHRMSLWRLRRVGDDAELTYRRRERA